MISKPHTVLRRKTMHFWPEILVFLEIRLIFLIEYSIYLYPGVIHETAQSPQYCHGYRQL